MVHGESLLAQRVKAVTLYERASKLCCEYYDTGGLVRLDYSLVN